jgi:hypothetical protein
MTWCRKGVHEGPMSGCPWCEDGVLEPAASAEGQRGEWWCCKADFGEHEPTCRNYFAAAPADQREVRELAEQIFRPLRQQAERALSSSTQPATAIESLRQATKARFDLDECGTAKLLGKFSASLASRARLEEAEWWRHLAIMHDESYFAVEGDKRLAALRAQAPGGGK